MIISAYPVLKLQVIYVTQFVTVIYTLDPGGPIYAITYT